MIDKEIIIDGVNVAECSYSYFEIYEDLENKREVVRCSIGSAFNNNRCQNENCYFKQLHRKEQECDNLISGMDFLQQKLAVKEHQCEELEEEVDYSHNQNIRWAKAWVKMWQQRNRYKQALEEIKIIAQSAKKNICSNCGWYNTDNCNPEDYICKDLIKIITIINEVNS